MSIHYPLLINQNIIYVIIMSLRGRKWLSDEADFCTAFVPDSDEIERFAQSADSETLGAWKKSKTAIQLFFNFII